MLRCLVISHTHHPALANHTHHAVSLITHILHSLTQGAWPVTGPSPIPFAEGFQVPREMTQSDIDAVIGAFAAAAARSMQAGFQASVCVCVSERECVCVCGCECLCVCVACGFNTVVDVCVTVCVCVCERESSMQAGS